MSLASGTQDLFASSNSSAIASAFGWLLTVDCPAPADAFDGTRTEDWILGLALAALLLLPFETDSRGLKSREYYNNLVSKYRIRGVPGAGVFGPVWIVLYLLIDVAIVLWASRDDSFATHQLRLTIWILLIVNLLFNKVWTVLFFSYRKILLALIDAILLFLTTLAIWILFWFDCPTWRNRNVPLILWGFYVVWTLYAMILSAQFIPAWREQRKAGTVVEAQHPYTQLNRV